MSSDAFTDPMTENLSPHQAARVLADASRYEDRLHQRTEGLTLMIWGLVGSAIFTSYAFVGAMKGPAWAYGTVWIPWVVFGLAFTMALWRSAALSRLERTPDHEHRWDGLKSIALVAVIGAVFFFAKPDGPEVPLLILGTAYGVMFGVDLFRTTRQGRWIGFASGATVALVGVVLAIAKLPVATSAYLAIAVPAVVIGGFGLWQTLRG